MRYKNSRFSWFLLLLWVGVAAYLLATPDSWEVTAEKICIKYAEHLRILRSVNGKSDGAVVAEESTRWRAEYDKLDDDLWHAVRRTGVSLNLDRYGQFYRRWDTIDRSVSQEYERIRQMNGLGPDYDKELGQLYRTRFSNPFR